MAEAIEPKTNELFWKNLKEETAGPVGPLGRLSKVHRDLIAPLLEALPEEHRKLANVVVYNLHAFDEQVVHATVALLQSLVDANKAKAPATPEKNGKKRKAETPASGEKTKRGKR